MISVFLTWREEIQHVFFDLKRSSAKKRSNHERSTTYASAKTDFELLELVKSKTKKKNKTLGKQG